MSIDPLQPPDDRAVGLSVEERKDVCAVEERTENFRSNQAISDFADKIFPDLPSTISMFNETTNHDGIFRVPIKEAREYAETHQPAVLRYNKRADTLGLSARNIGVAKGSTFDSVLIFPTRPMIQFLDDEDATKLTTLEHLYVAVTRARHSVAFVVPT